MNKSIQQMEDEVMSKCLDELARYKATFVMHFALTLKTQENIKDLRFKNLSSALQQRCDNELSGLSVFFRDCIREMGGIPALVLYDKPGEGLLRDCVVIPVQNKEQ